VLATIAFALFAVVPVSADVIQPINPTKVYFENNGTPVNEKVTFTVNCYGYHSSSGAPPAQSKPSESENVFWFSATCPSYGCTVFERYNLGNRYIKSCDLEGQLNDENFIIRNFANNPVPNCTDLHQYDISSGGRYYRTNDRYQACFDNSTGTPDTYFTRRDSCLKQYGDEINETDLILNDRGEQAKRMCTLQFTIPPERYVPTPTPVHTPTTTPVPLPAHIVLASVVLASGLVVMVRMKKNS